MKLREWMNALPALVALLAALLVAVRANLYFLDPSPALLHGFDEAYAVAIGRRMVEGNFLPYVDGVSHRGPLFYASVALAVKIFGVGTWLPVRALGLTTIVSTIVLGFFAAWAAKRSLAGAVMALVYTGVICVAMLLEDGLAYNSEHPLAVFSMASLLCLVFALRPQASAGRSVWAGCAGVALSASGLCKQTGFALLLPFGLWVLLAAVAAPQLSARERKTVPLAFVLGVALPLVALIARYALVGELATLYYYLVTYNEIYVRASLGFQPLLDSTDALLSHFYVFLALSPLVLAVILAGLSKVRRFQDVPSAYAEHGFDTSVGIALLILPFVVNASLRNFDHYYVQVAPFAGLALGIAVERLLGELSTGKLELLARCAALLPLFAVVELGWQHRVRSFQQDENIALRFSTQDSPLCRFLHEHSKPDDSIFIWGFFPAPYTACNRRPASRYVYTPFVAGYVVHVNDPPANDAARVAPGSRDILLNELRDSRPAVILDAPLTLGMRSLWAYPYLREFVTAEYCERTDHGQPGIRAWVRRGHEPCPAS